MKQIQDLCNKKKDLVKAIKSCSDENKYSALVCLMDNLKKRRQVLRSAEHSRKKRWPRKHLLKCLFKDPFKAAKEVKTTKMEKETRVPKSVLNKYMQKVSLDPDMTLNLGELEGLADIKVNNDKFNSDKFKISELFLVVKKRNTSQPSPNQTLYKVYKKCTKIKNYIF